MFLTIRFTVRNSGRYRFPHLVGGLTACPAHADDLRAHASFIVEESEGDIISTREVLTSNGACPVCQSHN